jgi:hypothetical protein
LGARRQRPWSSGGCSTERRGASTRGGRGNVSMSSPSSCRGSPSPSCCRSPSTPSCRGSPKDQQQRWRSSRGGAPEVARRRGRGALEEAVGLPNPAWATSRLLAAAPCSPPTAPRALPLPYTSSSRRMGRSRGPESTASAVQRRRQRCCHAVAAASARPLARGAPAADEQLRRSCPSLSSLPILVNCGQPGGGAQCGASGEGRVRPNLQVASGRWGWCGPTCRRGGSAGRTAKGQNHGVDRCPYAFFRGKDKA